MPPSGTRPQPPNGSCRVAISGTQSGLPWTNVFYLKLTDDGTETSADLKSVIDAVMASWHTNISPLHCSNVITTDVKATWIVASGAFEYQSSVSFAGTRAGTAVANLATCAVVNWAINQYYRGGHPRTYHPSVATADETGGQLLASGYQTSLATAYSTWLTAVQALTATHITNVQLGTVSFARANAWRTPPVFYQYKSVGIRNIFGTQRRRLGGR